MGSKQMLDERFSDERTEAPPAEDDAVRRFETPDAEDWVLVLA